MTLCITVPPGFTVFSSQPVAVVTPEQFTTTHVFRRTPRISVSQLGLAVGEFNTFSTHADNGVRVAVHIPAVLGQLDDGLFHHALNVACKVGLAMDPQLCHTVPRFGCR